MPKYRVQVVDPNSGRETRVTVTASTRERAAAKARLLGLVSGRVEEAECTSAEATNAHDGHEYTHHAPVMLVLLAGFLATAVLLMVVLDRGNVRQHRHSDAPIETQSTASSNPVPATTPAPPAVAEVEPPEIPEPALNAITIDGPYAVIPVTGTIGEDTLSEPIEMVLNECVVRNIPTVVFEIDSGGGCAQEGLEIAKLVDSFRGRLTRIAIVQQAHSAASWIAVSCDIIVMEPGSAIGAAVTFSENITTGEKSVDAKMNAAIGAQMAGLAAANGHNPDIVRAMCIREAELFAWKDPSSSRIVVAAHEPPPGAIEVERLDTTTSVLDLDAGKAEKLGFALRRTNPGLKFNYSTFIQEPNNLGAFHMRHAVESRRAKLKAEVAAKLETARLRREAAEREEAQRRARHDALQEERRLAAERAREEEQRAAEELRRFDEVTGLLRKLDPYTEDARRREPSRYADYLYSTRTGLLTPDSQLLWTSRSDSAVTAWQTVRRGLEDIARVMEKYGVDRSQVLLKSDVEARYTEAGMAIDRIRANRVRY